MLDNAFSQMEKNGQDKKKFVIFCKQNKITFQNYFLLIDLSSCKNTQVY